MTLFLIHLRHEGNIVKTRLYKTWDSLTTSLWFVPVLITACSVALAFALIHVDTVVRHETIEGSLPLYTGDAEGAREVLSSIAGSMITVAGVVFSITIVSLTLASQQLGPRLLGNFMKDTGNQVVLGTFIGTFIYCLLVLRTVRGSGNSEFVPSISVTVSVLLAMASLGVLIFFIHHVAMSIQATTVIDRVHRELDLCAERLFPETLGKDESELGDAAPGMPESVHKPGVSVAASRRGYIEAVVNEQLMRTAASKDLIVHLIVRPGDYVMKGQTIARLWPSGGDSTDGRLVKEINACLVLGRQRSRTQDIRFLFDQLTEIAVRALSPGINDPYTATNCIDHICSGLTLLAQRKIPSPLRYDDSRNLRVIASPVTFVELADFALGPIRTYGSSSPLVLTCLLESIEMLGPFVRRSGDRKALLRHTALIREAAASLKQESERKAVEQLASRTETALEKRVA